MIPSMTRRSFVRNTALSTATLTLARPSSHAVAADAAPAPVPPAGALAALPKAKLGKLEVSRLILGGNLFPHFTHSRDLKYVYTLAAKYNTDDKIFETLAAGAIPPKNAFRFAFHNGADFVLAGMFDFEIADDVKLANEVLSQMSPRARPWVA
jgi:hypothetical protein